MFVGEYELESRKEGEGSCLGEDNIRSIFVIKNELQETEAGPTYVKKRTLV